MLPPVGAGGLWRVPAGAERHMSGAQDFRVALDGVDLDLGGRPIFRGLSCGFPRGQISVVLGGSGAGKSTLLRLIGGLQRPDSGSVRVVGRDITRISESEMFDVRDCIGMLFQGGALLDSMTIAENVALPLREHSELEDADIVAEVQRRLVAVGLSETGDYSLAQPGRPRSAPSRAHGPRRNG